MLCVLHNKRSTSTNLADIPDGNFYGNNNSSCTIIHHLSSPSPGKQMLNSGQEKEPRSLVFKETQSKTNEPTLTNHISFCSDEFEE